MRQNIWSLLVKILNFGNQLQSDKSELNIIQMIPINFSLRLPMIETQTNSDISQPEILLGCGMTEISYIMKHLENTTNSTMLLTA